MKPHQTLEFEEGYLHLNCIIKGEWYSDKIKLPQLGNQAQETQFAETIGNLIKNTMLAAGFKKESYNGIPIIK